MDIVLTLLAGLVGAVVGGICTLVGAERALNASLMVSKLERQQGYLASLDAAQLELEGNLQRLQTGGGPEIGSLGIWLPLQSEAIHRLLAGDVEGIPAPVLTVSPEIARYNALASASVARFEAGQSCPEPLRAEITAMIAGLVRDLGAAKSAVEQTAHGLRTWTTTVGRLVRPDRRSPWYTRAWGALTRPKVPPLPGPPQSPA